MNKTIKHTVTKQGKEKITKSILSHLQQHREIYTAYLFGSYITDKAFGDIDLGLLIRSEPENLLEYEFELEIKLEELEKFPVDVRVLNNAPVSFVQNVLRHGEVILDKEPNMRSDFESYSLRKYFDFSPFRRRYLAEVINAPL